MAHRICIRQWGTPYYFESGDFCKFKVVSHRYVTGCQSSPSYVIARAWNSKMLPNSYLILMRVLWVVIKSSLATCSVNSAFSSEQSLGLCAHPSKLTRRFIQLFSKGPHSWAYSQEGELVFQWISLSIWMASGWNTAPAEGSTLLCSATYRIKCLRLWRHSALQERWFHFSSHRSCIL